MPKSDRTHIALTAYDLENGGISRVAVYLANGFAQAGHRVTLLLCTSAGERDDDLRAMLQPEVSCRALSNRRFSSRALGQIACLPAFRRWLRREKPDIVMGTANNIAWFSGGGLIGKRQPKSALYIKTTNPVIREKDGSLLTGIRRLGYTRLFGKTASILTLSDAESRILEQEFPRNSGKFRSVFNAYLTDRFLSQPIVEKERNGTLQLLAIGRLSRQKNMARLIEAFALAKKMDSRGGSDLVQSAHLTIAGEGPELEMLQALAKNRGVAGQISFPGFSHDIPGMLREADIFVLSSNYEGFPAVVIEALGSNCPVVSTDCFPAARELLAGLPGCALAERTAESLARAILESAKVRSGDPALRARVLDYGIDSATNSHLAAMGL